MENKYLIISIISFWISLIFLLVQGILNFIFLNPKDREIIVERTLFEQFSYEVYSSIKTSLPMEIEIKDQCEDGEEPVDFILNFDSFYDCRGIHSSELKESCQDKIINNYTICSNYFNYDKMDFTYSNSIPEYDIGKEDCTYFSRFTQKIQKINGYYICKKELKSYDELLSNSVKNKNYGNVPNSCADSSLKRCGILDTMDNILCLEECPKIVLYLNDYNDGQTCLKIEDQKYLCLIESSDPNKDKIFNSIIISENKPLNHQWDKMIKDIYEDLSTEEFNKRRDAVSPDFKLIDEEKDNTYELLSHSMKFKISDFIQKIRGVDKKSIYNMDYPNINIYTRNYIGFENSDELVKFKKNFDDKNDTNNPLYKLSSSKHDPLITIVFSCFFFCIAIAYLILIFKKVIPEKYFKLCFYIFIAILILFSIAAIIIIGYHFYHYPKISINMDKRMKVVLDKYNERTINYQLFRIISFCFDVISAVFILLHHFKGKVQNQQIEHIN